MEGGCSWELSGVSSVPTVSVGATTSSNQTIALQVDLSGTPVIDMNYDGTVEGSPAVLQNEFVTLSQLGGLLPPDAGTTVYQSWTFGAVYGPLPTDPGDNSSSTFYYSTPRQFQTAAAGVVTSINVFYNASLGGTLPDAGPRTTYGDGGILQVFIGDLQNGSVANQLSPNSQVIGMLTIPCVPAGNIDNSFAIVGQPIEPDGGLFPDAGYYTVTPSQNWNPATSYLVSNQINAPSPDAGVAFGAQDVFVPLNSSGATNPACYAYPVMGALTVQWQGVYTAP
jgi:hypothetical protein